MEINEKRARYVRHRAKKMVANPQGYQHGIKYQLAARVLELEQQLGIKDEIATLGVNEHV